MSMSEENKNIIKENKYYVYGLVSPLDNSIFYIGKGSGNRAYDHLKPSGWGKNPHKLNKIKQIRKNGKEPIILFLHKDLDEKTAFSLEIFEIKRLRQNGVILTNMTDGGDCGPIRVGKRNESERKKISDKTKEAMWDPQIRKRYLNSINNESHRKKLSENQIKKIRSNKDWFDKFTKSNYKKEYRNKHVIRDDGKVFNSAEDVAKFYGTRLNVITRHLEGKRKTYRKHTFRYLDI